MTNISDNYGFCICFYNVVSRRVLVFKTSFTVKTLNQYIVNKIIGIYVSTESYFIAVNHYVMYGIFFDIHSGLHYDVF